MIRLDHVSVGVPDLKAGVDAYVGLGFELGGEAIAFNEEDYLELRAGREGLGPIALRGDGLAGDLAGLHLTLVAKPRPRAAARHPNGAFKLERVYIGVADVAAAAATYARALGLPVPKIERGTVIKADMAVFDLGPTGLALAQPAGPGPAADALARRGPGPFQVLYRTKSMDAAARWMAGRGLPPPPRGVRNTGEQAMLVSPQYACGVYVGFVGPA